MSIELDRVRTDRSGALEDGEHVERELPTMHPADTGTHAWMCMLGGFLVEIILWGNSIYKLAIRNGPCNPALTKGYLQVSP